MSQQKRVQSCCNDQEGYELSASDESEPDEELSQAPFDQELDDSDDGGAEVCARGSAPPPVSAFILSGGNSAFSDRSRSIFDCLDSVERQSAPPLTGESTPPPQCPPPTKKRGVPDYLLHPERWTRYSLEDVKETTDQENRRAAHNFLSSLRPEEGKPPPSEPPHDHQQKMIFSKPKRPFKEELAESSSEQQGKEKRLHLSHLAEEEEEDCKPARRTEKDGEEGQDQQESLPSFTSFKKMKGKNYRRTSDHKDD